MNFQYKLVSSMCKVFSGGENINELKEKRLTGLKGETVSCQVAYYWGEDGMERGSPRVFMEGFSARR